jgi:hypothetical protein
MISAAARVKSKVARLSEILVTSIGLLTPWSAENRKYYNAPSRIDERKRRL